MRGSRWLCKVQRGFMEINDDFKSAAQLFCAFSIRVYIFMAFCRLTINQARNAK